jgi:hypothetical protein
VVCDVHWSTVGQPAGVGGAFGQQTHTQAADPLTVTVVALVADWPAPVTVPGSPEPWSPAVSCQGALPSSKPGSAVVERATEPAATQAVMVEFEDGCMPAIDTEHHLSKFCTVSATGVLPEHVAVSPPEPPLEPQPATEPPTAKTKATAVRFLMPG